MMNDLLTSLIGLQSFTDLIRYEQEDPGCAVGSFKEFNDPRIRVMDRDSPQVREGK